MKNNFKSMLWVRKLYRSRRFWTVRNAIRNMVQKYPIDYPVLDDRNELEVGERILISWPDNLPKPNVGLVQDKCNPPYWTKYERFLRNNQFSFEYFDIHYSGWLDAAKAYDVIIWATEGKAPQIEEQKRKTYFLENNYSKICFPSYDTLMWHEDKIFQYEWLKMFGFPVIDTFISNSASEALEKIKQFSYPIVTKHPVGAGSLGVEIVKDSKVAKKIIWQSFSPSGRHTYWPYIRQKDFVFFQKFQPNEGYDLRVIVVGNRLFGYFRDVPQGEYRASGMGLVRRDDIPEDAMLLAMKIKEKLGLIIVAVDMLRDPEGELHIIEMSAFIQVDTGIQLEVGGIPGAYIFDSTGKHRFEPGKVWIQELALKDFFEKIYLEPKIYN